MTQQHPDNQRIERELREEWIRSQGLHRRNGSSGAHPAPAAAAAVQETPAGRFFVSNALREALRLVVNDLRCEWERELALMKAQSQSAIDQLRVENAELRAKLAERGS